MFGHYHNPSNSAMPYFNQVPGIMNQYYSPYINAGNQELPYLQNQYQGLMNNPGQMINSIGSNYQQSPGFQFQLQQALQGSNNAAAAGGLAGSPEHQQQNMSLATDLANQNYNQYLQNALGQYDVGLEGAQGLYNTGSQAGMGLGDALGSLYNQEGQYAYAGKAGQNAYNSGMMNNIFGLGGAAMQYNPWNIFGQR